MLSGGSGMSRWQDFIYRNAEKNVPYGIAEQGNSNACALWFNTVCYLLYGLKANVNSKNT